MKDFPRIQVITKKIDVQKFIKDEFYYDKKEKEIKRVIKKDANIVIIHLETDQKIKELWVMEMLLHLQRTFSKVVIIPDSDVPSDELEDWLDIFKPTAILKAC